MLKSMSVRNLTVFQEAVLRFSPTLNVFVGENGAGKTHLLKMAYSTIWVSHAEGRKARGLAPTKSAFQVTLADKLVNVFRPDSLGRLARRRQGRERCDVSLKFDKSSESIAFGFATNSRSEVNVEALPSGWIDKEPTFLPTRELLSIFPTFVSFYEGHYVEYEETWRDTCVLLGRPLRRGPTEQKIAKLLQPLEIAMGGSIELDSKSGRFYLVTAGGRMEIPLVAEGLRKLGMLARLIATGALLDRGFLFWDEPEANLNPKLIRQIAQSIIQLSEHGIQVFIATHSLFLLREIEIIQSSKKGKVARFFGLHCTQDGVIVQQGDSVSDIGAIVALEEELHQSDRFLESEA
jgi:hypothetical protein